jgi:hypothetical protein
MNPDIVVFPPRAVGDWQPRVAKGCGRDGRAAASARLTARGVSDKRRRAATARDFMMDAMTNTTFSEIPGGQTLIDWFAHVPRFHDANLLEITLASKGTSTLRIHAWRMTDKVDDRGYYVLDKHVVVAIDLEEVTYVALTDFNLPGII